MSSSSRVWMYKKMYEIFLLEFWTFVDEGTGLFRKAGNGLQSHGASHVKKSKSSLTKHNNKLPDDGLLNGNM